MRLLLSCCAIVLLSCSDEDSPFIGSGPTPTESVKRVGGMTSLNGYTATGNIEIVNIIASNTNLFRTKPDFAVTSSLGKVSLYLTDSIGTISLAVSSVKTKIGDITSGFSGQNDFSLGLTQYTAYDYAIVRSDSANQNIGKAKLLLPLAPGDQ